VLPHRVRARRGALDRRPHAGDARQDVPAWCRPGRPAREDSFTVSLIPETLARTTLGSRRVGDLVNLEADVIAKHVEKLLGAYTPTSASTHTPENDEEE